MRRLLGSVLVLGVAGLVAIGCGGKPEGQPIYSLGPTGPPTGAAATYDVRKFPNNPDGQVVSPTDVLTAHAFTITGSADFLDLISVNVELESVQGTNLDPSMFVTAYLLLDSVANMRADPAELASPVASTAVSFAANATPVTFSLNVPTFPAPYRINPGTSHDFIVALAVDPARIGPGIVGFQLEGKIPAAADLLLLDGTRNQIPATPGTGNFGDSSNPTLVGINHDLLISEIGMVGASVEFIEIYNPSPDVIDLANYHLTDFTDNGAANGYFRLPAGGGNFGPPGGAAVATTDFTVRFPGGQVNPGEVIVVAIDGDTFATFSGFTPSFCLRNPGAGQIPLMLTWDGTTGQVPVFPSPAVPAANGVTLDDNGESVILFWYDGGNVSGMAQDLVLDVDIVHYGINAQPQDKGGVGVDGFDPDTTASNYPAETPVLTQAANKAPIAAGSFQNTISRIDYFEGAEVRGGAGNGRANGDDETSEDWSNTFKAGPTTIGAP